MRRVDAAAPGKAVLIGEYAVLHGAPALVLAVERRVRVSVRACSPEASRLEVPQLAADALAFDIGQGGRLRWQDPRADRQELALCRNLLARALEQAADRRLPEPGGVQVRIDSSELYLQSDDALNKLGLGSSAAVTVALSAALQLYLQGPGPDARPRLVDLLQSHAQAQGGRGSGLDVAAALEGGLVLYRLAPAGPEMRSLSWPSNWALLFVWTGEAASTGRFLERYERWRASDPSGAAKLWRAMDACAREAWASLESTALDRFMTCINNYRDLMGKIGSRIRAPVLTPQHRRLTEIGLEIGAAYKPCGAGGGDLGVFVAADGEQLEQIRSRIEACGFRELALKPALTGLQLAMTENDSGSR